MRLYWVDAFFDKIEHSNFDGQNRLSLDRITQISHPFGLTIFEGNLSWHLVVYKNQDNRMSAVYSASRGKIYLILITRGVHFTASSLNCGLSFLDLM